MSLAPTDILERARALCGVRFRPQGRDPATGLDCVGIVVRVFGIPTELVRRDYRLRGPHGVEIGRVISRWFRRIDPSHSCSGDVLHFAVSGSQDHLAIVCGPTFIHADASLRRVVETPMPAAWPIAGAFRSRSLQQPD